METLALGCVLGLAQGVRHAFEPDHLAAVSTVVAEQKSARASARFASLWGVGHAAMLLAVGGALYVLRREMPERLGQAFELGVAVMLIALGIRALRHAVRAGRAGAVALHKHGGLSHAHPVAAAHVHVGGVALVVRPLVIGLVHGLAGSGAMTALVAATYPSALEGLLFIAVYGLGATLGMASLARVVGIPLARAMTTRRGPTILLALTGVVSLALGVMWGWPIVNGLAAH